VTVAMVAMDRRSLSFMYSFPNYIPLNAGAAVFAASQRASPSRLGVRSHLWGRWGGAAISPAGRPGAAFDTSVRRYSPRAIFGLAPAPEGHLPAARSSIFANPGWRLLYRGLSATILYLHSSEPAMMTTTGLIPLPNPQPFPGRGVRRIAAPDGALGLFGDRHLPGGELISNASGRPATSCAMRRSLRPN